MGLAVLGLFFFVLFLVFAPAGFSKTPVIFQVQKGQGSSQIAKHLKQQGLIRSELAFKAYAKIAGIATELKAGEYELHSGYSMHVIAQKIAQGEVAREFLTIPEGWNLGDIASYLESKEAFSEREFFEIAGSPAFDYRRIAPFPLPRDFSQEYEFLKDKPKTIGLEGYLFPDTYHMPKGSSIEDILRQMLDNFGRKFTPDLQEKAAAQRKSIAEIVTMASLVEKEVQTEQDKRIVSGILWKRIGAGMPLQVDATIAYLTGKKTTKISLEETQIDSPYNTYRYRGLPFGPIANPGLDSMKAALEPVSSPYWYYLSTPTGETIFSTTLEEHNLAKATHLK